MKKRRVDKNFGADKDISQSIDKEFTEDRSSINSLDNAQNKMCKHGKSKGGNSNEENHID